MYDPNFQTDIHRIKELVEKLDSEAVNQFGLYLESIKNIGNFSSTNWPATFRNQIYDFGMVFETVNADAFLKKIEEYKNKYPESCEIYDFIYSEIIWSFFEQNNSYIKDELHSLIKKYPTNPEFHHTYSHFLEQNNNFDQALFEIKTALKIEPDNNIFINTYIFKVKEYFDHLILKGKVDEAEKVIDVEEKESKNNKIFTNLRVWNILSSLKDRLKDHKSMQEKIKYFEKEIENRIQTEQKRLIEVLGIFSAILGFILTSITIGITNLSIHSMLILMFGMSLVLLVFAISISYLFGKSYRYADFFFFLKQPKFYAGIICFTLLISLIFFVK